MVLLTSSTVSVIVSSGVVCVFTFLLFLSGYVLQQQSVRSIQEAIRRPPELKPVPTLPPQFRQPENETVAVAIEQPQDGLGSMVRSEGRLMDSVQVPVGARDQGQLGLGTSLEEQKSREDPPLQRLAYIFALEEPSHLCSALLFAKQQRAASRLSVEPSIVLLYPATWEIDSSSLYTTTLSFMRQIQELYDLIYHPVRIHAAWDIRSQLLGELQWSRWDYDQAMYLRSPGMMLDGKVLDAALAFPDTRKSWAPLNPSSGDNPDILLITPRGLQSPRGQTRKLVLSASSGVIETEGNEAGTGELRRNAAYVLFDDSSLSDSNHVGQYSNLKRQFDDGTSKVCEASRLLENK